MTDCNSLSSALQAKEAIDHLLEKYAAQLSQWLNEVELHYVQISLMEAVLEGRTLQQLETLLQHIDSVDSLEQGLGQLS